MRSQTSAPRCSRRETRRPARGRGDGRAWGRGDGGEGGAWSGRAVVVNRGRQNTTRSEPARWGYGPDPQDPGVTPLLVLQNALTLRHRASVPATEIVSASPAAVLNSHSHYL